MLLGFELHIGGKSISLIYTTTVSCFAIAYFYHREFKPEDMSQEASELTSFSKERLEKAIRSL